MTATARRSCGPPGVVSRTRSARQPIPSTEAPAIRSFTERGRVFISVSPQLHATELHELELQELELQLFELHEFEFQYMPLHELELHELLVQPLLSAIKDDPEGAREE